MIGLFEYKKKNASEEYKKGLMTLSEAAKSSGLTLWEMEQYLIFQGYKSEYSILDLEEEMKILRNKDH